MSTREETPSIVRWTQALEDTSALDGAVHTLEGPVRTIFGTGTRGEVLRGDWLGHALHPVLTDVVIGSWTSATVLDLVGGKDSATSARRLIGVGILAFGPTAWAGWAEWSNTGTREKRVGLVHDLDRHPAMLRQPSTPVEACAAPTGLDSGEPRWRR